MKAMKQKQFMRMLSEMGATWIRNGKGSHMIFEYNGQRLSVPNHKEISPGTQRDIMKLIKNADNKIAS